MAERIFRTLKEVKDAFFPDIPMEELLGDPTEEEQLDEVKKIIEAPKREPPQIDSKKLPR